MTQMIELSATNEAEAKSEIQALSERTPGVYFTAAACFGLFAVPSKRLPAQAPSDTPFDWYVLNGKVRLFSTAQHEANQRATPALS